MDVNLFVSPLLRILSDEDETAELMMKRTVSAFPSSDRFKVACTLSKLLMDRLLPFPQRLGAFYLLYNLYPPRP